MDEIQVVSVQSFHKATLIQLFNNEGEVKWGNEKLNRRIFNNPKLSAEMKNAGYDKNQKDFTAAQVALLFKYISHPILNKANKRVLKIKDHKHGLLDNFENNPELICNDMEDIKKLEDGALSGLGLRKKNGGDLNPHYVFTDNDKVYFTKVDLGFKMHENATLRVVKVITSTEYLIKELLKLKNELNTIKNTTLP